MRKAKTQQKKDTAGDEALDAALAIGAGIALVAVFGGLGLLFGWKAIVAGAPLV